MADTDDSAQSFPKVPAKAWQVLQSRAAASPSSRFTPSFIAPLLGLKTHASARTNIVRPMKQMGLFNDDGTLTPRGNKWRVTSTYPDACQEILDDLYPPELGGLTDDEGSPDKTKLTAWFSQQGYGSSNATQMAATYAMVAGKQIPDPAPTPKSAGRSNPAKPNAAPKPKPAEVAATATVAHQAPPQAPSQEPSVQLNIQIHIPTDSTPEQIDQIFASMAKHIYQR